MDPTDETRIAAVRKVIEPYLRRTRHLAPEPTHIVTSERRYVTQESADPPYPPRPGASSGQSIGRAWQAATERLPEGWIVDRLSLETRQMWTSYDGSITQKGNVWKAHARPSDSFAWRKSGLKHLKDGHHGQGLSPVEALLDLAVRAESTEPFSSSKPRDRMEAVDALFGALFPEP